MHPILFTMGGASVSLSDLTFLTVRVGANATASYSLGKV
jgi:hypothetical protein